MKQAAQAVSEYFEAICSRHGLTRWKREPSGRKRCLLCCAEYRRKYRKTENGKAEKRRWKATPGGKANQKYHKEYARYRNEQYILEQKEPGCSVCGYSKCAAALHFHHIDDVQKESLVSDFKKRKQSLQKLIDELAKCVLLCANCHAELHDGIIQIKEMRNG